MSNRSLPHSLIRRKPSRGAKWFECRCSLLSIKVRRKFAFSRCNSTRMHTVQLMLLELQQDCAQVTQLTCALKISVQIKINGIVNPIIELNHVYITVTLEFMCRVIPSKESRSIHRTREFCCPVASRSHCSCAATCKREIGVRMLFHMALLLLLRLKQPTHITVSTILSSPPRLYTLLRTTTNPITTLTGPYCVPKSLKSPPTLHPSSSRSLRKSDRIVSYLIPSSVYN